MPPSPIAERLRAVPNRSRRVDLAAVDPSSTPGAPGRDEAKAELAGPLTERLALVSDLLDANGDRRVLLVLQGLDGSGKSGFIRHVVGAMTPAIVRVRAFKEPTAEEADHHFLWRIERELPEPGELVVFDRSHYEDLVMPFVDGELSRGDLRARAEEVNAFERDLVKKRTTVIKCFLHLSYDAQRERFLRRLRRADKRWKFSESDLDTRDRWGELQAAFSAVIGLTHTTNAPWHVVPADHRWYRNWVGAHLVAERLEELELTYPQPELDRAALRRRLEGERP